MSRLRLCIVQNLTSRVHPPASERRSKRRGLSPDVCRFRLEPPPSRNACRWPRRKMTRTRAVTCAVVPVTRRHLCLCTTTLHSAAPGAEMEQWVAFCQVADSGFLRTLPPIAGPVQHGQRRPPAAAAVRAAPGRPAAAAVRPDAVRLRRATAVAFRREHDACGARPQRARETRSTAERCAEVKHTSRCLRRPVSMPNAHYPTRRQPPPPNIHQRS